MPTAIPVTLRKKVYDSSTDATQGVVVYDAQNKNIYVGGDSIVEHAIDVTYDNLISLINAEGLRPGMDYRITDYVTRVSNELYNISSAEHPFMLVVRATSTNTISEDAHAVMLPGDTYFDYTDPDTGEHINVLSKWEIKYSVENDIYYGRTAHTQHDFVVTAQGTVYIKYGTKIDSQTGDTLYCWASRNEFLINDIIAPLYSISDYPAMGTIGYLYLNQTGDPDHPSIDGATNDIFYKVFDSGTFTDVDATDIGKGTIYYMKDEFGNEANYDFKNILFRRWRADIINEFPHLQYNGFTSQIVADFSNDGYPASMGIMRYELSRYWTYTDPNTGTTYDKFFAAYFFDRFSSSNERVIECLYTDSYYNTTSDVLYQYDYSSQQMVLSPYHILQADTQSDTFAYPLALGNILTHIEHIDETVIDTYVSTLVSSYIWCPTFSFYDYSTSGGIIDGATADDCSLISHNFANENRLTTDNSFNIRDNVFVGAAAKNTFIRAENNTFFDCNGNTFNSADNCIFKQCYHNTINATSSCFAQNAYENVFDYCDNSWLLTVGEITGNSAYQINTSKFGDGVSFNKFSSLFNTSIGSECRYNVFRREVSSSVFLGDSVSNVFSSVSDSFFVQIDHCTSTVELQGAVIGTSSAVQSVPLGRLENGVAAFHNCSFEVGNPNISSEIPFAKNDVYYNVFRTNVVLPDVDTYALEGRQKVWYMDQQTGMVKFIIRDLPNVSSRPYRIEQVTTDNRVIIDELNSHIGRYTKQITETWFNTASTSATNITIIYGMSGYNLEFLNTLHEHRIYNKTGQSIAYTFVGVSFNDPNVGETPLSDNNIYITQKTLTAEPDSIVMLRCYFDVSNQSAIIDVSQYQSLHHYSNR